MWADIVSGSADEFTKLDRAMSKKTRSTSTTLVVVTISLLSSGCGLLMTTAPPANHVSLPAFSCTESNVGPGLDGIMAGMMVLNGGLTLANSDDYYYSKKEAHTVVAINAGLGLLYGISASKGMQKTKDCRAAKQEFMLRMAQQQPSTAETQNGTIIQFVRVTPVVDTLSIGEHLQLEASAHTMSGALLKDRAFTWSSSNREVASVNSSGLAIAQRAGTVTIVATSGITSGVATIVVR